MKFEIKTVTILMYAALALALGSCTKKTITPAEDPQPAEVGFTASSQAVWVKGETDLKTTFPYTNFGVWGIARHQHVESPYILWSTNQLTEVSAPEGTSTNQETSNVVFTPATAAYWLGGYEYSFLAIAPYTDPGFSLVGITQASGSNTSDSMSFTYDMSSKYENPNTYTFDLLGGAAKTDGPVAGGRTSEQELTFWHLLSQIEIKNIGFASGINGRVDKIVLRAFPSAVYTISHDNSSDNRTKPTGIACDEITVKNDGEPADKSEITFTNPNFSVFHPIINIIPQAVANLELYIDFTITQDTITDEYKDFKINLNAQELTEYVYNGKYNWNITIGTRNAITFDVSVTPWQDAIVPEEYPLS